MKKIILLAFVAVSITAQAQPIYVDRIGFKLESIADIDIGWMEIRKHTTAPKGKQLGDRIYSAKQIGNCQQFVEWMQQSYLPKGCLGDATYYQNYIPKFSSTSENRQGASGWIVFRTSDNVFSRDYSAGTGTGAAGVDTRLYGCRWP